MMDLRQVLEALRGLEAAGVVERYAVGGAVGATFYLEPVATLDVDIFVAFRADEGRKLLRLTPIYEYLETRGAAVEGEHRVIHGWPVQFLPASTPLLREAMKEAREVDVEGVGTRVFTAEHLAAIALETGRAKDKARVLQFVEAKAVDPVRFEAVLVRHGLVERWKQFKRQFLSDRR